MKNKIKDIFGRVKRKKDFVVLDSKNYNNLMAKIKFQGDLEKF